jgi:hypothetical protein
MLATDIDSDGIAVLRLDNALSIAMRDAISDTLDEWATDDRVRVVVRTGTGTAFCAIKFGAPPLFTPLQWIVGAGIARDLCLTGRRIDVAEAASRRSGQRDRRCRQAAGRRETDSAGDRRSTAGGTRGHQALPGLQRGGGI